MNIKLLKVKNDDCFNCDVRTLSKKVNISMAVKLTELCENQKCATNNFIYKEIK